MEWKQRKHAIWKRERSQQERAERLRKGKRSQKNRQRKDWCVCPSLCVCHSLEITASLVLIPITHYA